MTMDIIIDGKTYTSKVTNEIGHEECANRIFDEMANMDRFKLQLEDGNYLVIGKDALQRAQLIFKA
jgi:hypothetical protein